jgi:electron transport complex protein RnfG
MKKSNLMPSLVLGSICLVVALLLSVVNMITLPEIEKNRKEKEIKALQEVLPEGSYFDPISITDNYPDVITGGYKSDKGYVFKAEVIGYQPGLIIMIGVDNDGKIAGVKHTATKETYGVENELNNAYTNKHDTVETLEMILSASASKGAPMTSAAYYKAIDAALEAAELASGRKVEEKYKGVESFEIDANGNYVFVAYGDGYGGKIRIKISITPDGKIASVETLSHNETPSHGGALLDGEDFYNKFIGIGQSGVGGVENTAGVTSTSDGFKEAVNNAFAAFESIKAEGGNG